MGSGRGFWRQVIFPGAVREGVLSAADSECRLGMLVSSTRLPGLTRPDNAYVVADRTDVIGGSSTVEFAFAPPPGRPDLPDRIAASHRGAMVGRKNAENTGFPTTVVYQGKGGE